MDDDGTPLNLTSRLILAATVALGLGAAVCTAPSSVAALGRAPLKAPVVVRPLSDTPGIAVTRAYGRDDVDCVARAPAGGATPGRLICVH